MRFTLLAVVVGVMAGHVAGGSHVNLATVRLRGWWLPAVWAGLYVFVGRVDVGPAVWLLMLAHVGFLGFVSLNVRATRGLWLVGVGLLLNLAVLVVNHTTPYRPAAVRAAGIHERRAGEVLRSSAVGRPERDGDRLTFLADIVPLDAGPFHEVLSIGDLLLGLGMGLVVFQALQPVPSPGTAAARHGAGGAPYFDADDGLDGLDVPDGPDGTAVSALPDDDAVVLVDDGATSPAIDLVTSLVDLTTGPPDSGPPAETWPRSASSSAIELLLRSSLVDPADLDAEAAIAGDEFWATRQRQRGEH